MITEAETVKPEEPTLRDRFAMAALPGLLANEAYTDDASDHDGWRDISKWAYELADAMLATRENT